MVGKSVFFQKLHHVGGKSRQGHPEHKVSRPDDHKPLVGRNQPVGLFHRPEGRLKNARFFQHFGVDAHALQRPGVFDIARQNFPLLPDFCLKPQRPLQLSFHAGSRRFILRRVHQPGLPAPLIRLQMQGIEDIGGCRKDFAGQRLLALKSAVRNGIFLVKTGKMNEPRLSQRKINPALMCFVESNGYFPDIRFDKHARPHASQIILRIIASAPNP